MTYDHCLYGIELNWRLKSGNMHLSYHVFKLSTPLPPLHFLGPDPGAGSLVRGSFKGIPC